MNHRDRSGLTRRNVDAQRAPESSPARRSVTSVFKALDANPKLKEDYVSESTSGKITTLVCALLCALLFFGEFFSYRTSRVVSELRVNPLGVHEVIPNAERLKIDIDITFHSLACNLITLDTADKAGEEHYDVHDGHIEKRRLDKHGKVIDTKITTEKPNKRKEMTQALKELNETSNENSVAAREAGHPEAFAGVLGVQKLLREEFPEGIEKAFMNEAEEGCEVKGYLEVNRVPGRFSISPGRSLMMGMQQIRVNVQTSLNLSHTIHRLSFGERFPGLVSPLDGTHRSLPPNAVQQYFLNVVSTSFEPLAATQNISTHQYSVTETFTTTQRSVMGMNGQEPGVYFTYEIAPIRVDFKETRKTFSSFVIGICSIIGGVVTMAGLVQGTVEYALAHKNTLFAS